MTTKEQTGLIKECLREYYTEDKEILVDSSIVQTIASIYMIYNLIFFGNKVIILDGILKELEKISRQNVISKRENIKVKNAEFILNSIKKDSRNNYKIIKSDYRMSKKENYKKILKRNSNCILYLSNYKLYNQLKDDGLGRQLYLLEEGKSEVNPFQDKYLHFETIGAIKFEKGKMVIRQKENVIINVYKPNGVKKEGEILEVKPRDFVLIKTKKENLTIIGLYETISKHSRNQSIRIIWTTLKNGEKSNKYIDELPYNIREIIEENVD